jgi:predicted metallopeptidase
MSNRRKRNTNNKVVFISASDVSRLINEIIKKLGLSYIVKSQVYCVRSTGSGSHAYARVWGLHRIFQEVAGYKPTYVIEVLSEKYDHLSLENKRKVLIHELMHIPKTFSGALLSHKGRYHKINEKEVNALYKRIYE